MSPERRGRGQHGQHDGQRAQVDLPPVGGQAEIAARNRKSKKHRHGQNQDLPVQPPQRGPRGGHAEQPLAAVPVHQPAAQAEHPRLLGHGRGGRQPLQVPGPPQRLGVPGVQRALLPDQGQLRSADAHPHDQQDQAQPPAPAGQHGAGQQPAGPVAHHQGQRHRRVGRHLADQLALGQGQVVQHLRVFQVRDADRPGHRGHQPFLGAVDQPPLHHRTDRRLHRSQHQRHGIQNARDGQRGDHTVPGRRGQPVAGRGGNVPTRRPAAISTRLGTTRGGDRIACHRGGERAAGLPQQPDGRPVTGSGHCPHEPFAKNLDRLGHRTRLQAAQIL